jgi:chromosome segregation ATPase
MNMTKNELSPERQTLAEVVAKRAELKSFIDGAAAADRSLQQKWYRFDGDIQTAKTAIEVAKTAAAKALIASHTGTQAPASGSVAEARAALQEIEDDRDATSSARTEIAAQLADAKLQLEITEVSLDNAIQKVVGADPAVKKFRDAYAEASERLAGMQRAASFLRRLAPRPENALAVRESWFPDVEPSDNALLEAWRASLNALKTDANAPLPTMEN